MVIQSSKGLVCPIGAVFGLNEDTESLRVLHEAFDRHCRDHGVNTPVFTPAKPRARFVPSKLPADAAWYDENLKYHLCPPEWEAVLLAIMRDGENFDSLLDQIPEYDDQSTLHTDGGTAFPSFCREYPRNHTSCGKHLVTKVRAGVHSLAPFE